MNCLLSSSFASHRVRYESTCANARRDNRVALNDGRPLFPTMRQRSRRADARVSLQQGFRAGGQSQHAELQFGAHDL